MAEIFRVKDLDDRKRALVAESEVYRQTLKLEIQNIRLYRARMQRKLDLLRFANPLFLLAGSFVGSRLFGRKARWRRRGRLSTLGISLMAWRIFKNFGPLIQGLIRQRAVRRGAVVAEPEDRTPAATI